MKHKAEKLIQVFILCPNDIEKPVLYFDSLEQAKKFAKTYRDGAFVSEKPELIPDVSLEINQCLLKGRVMCYELTIRIKAGG